VKVAVAGKGGVGKTTVAGTLARVVARSGRSVVALDADSNPMLGISLGIGPEETDRLVAVRQALDEGQVEHQPSVEELVAMFGTEAPDGVRLVVCNRLDTADPG
jgi:CO dehydrogenase maturation factor